jgi:hypothetical protein
MERTVSQLGGEALGRGRWPVGSAGFLGALAGVSRSRPGLGAKAIGTGGAYSSADEIRERPGSQTPIPSSHCDQRGSCPACRARTAHDPFRAKPMRPCVGCVSLPLQDPRRMPKCVQISPSLGQAQTVVLTFRAPALIRPVEEALFEGFGQQSGRLVTSSLLHRLQKLEQ